VLYAFAAPVGRARKIAVGALAAFVAAMTAFGAVSAAPPPGTVALALSSLVAIAVIAALAGWADRNSGRAL